MIRDANAGVTRRALLKGAGAPPARGRLGASPASRPCMAAGAKIVLRYLGTAVNQDKAIAEKFKEDTGITIQYVAVTTDDVTKRVVTQPNCFDIVDIEYFILKKIVPDRQPAGHGRQEDQEFRQDHADLHQGQAAPARRSATRAPRRRR